MDSNWSSEKDFRRRYGHLKPTGFHLISSVWILRLEEVRKVLHSISGGVLS
jgi:hypothetical protein